MGLRAELQPHKRTECERAEIRELVERVLVCLERGDDVSDDLAMLRVRTGRQFDEDLFEAYSESCSFDDLLKEIMCEPPRRVTDITRDELVDVISRAMPNSESYDAEFAVYYAALFDVNVPMPRASALIYHPPKDMHVSARDWDPSAEQIVEIALSYTPTILG